jgi:hypothetical protein
MLVYFCRCINTEIATNGFGVNISLEISIANIYETPTPLSAPNVVPLAFI